MIVILSQRIDIQSEYEDELFKTYHYPSRYRNQLHEGDILGDRRDVRVCENAYIFSLNAYQNADFI